MLNKEKVYIAGHRHPDTDPVASITVYVKLKQRQDFHAIVCRLDPVNAQTEYLLGHFHVDLSMLLEDARATLDEIEIDGLLVVSPQATIMETLELTNEQNKQFYGVINAQGKLMGMIIKLDLTTVGLGDIAVAIQPLQETLPEYIAKTVSWKMIYMDEVYRFNGKTSVIAIAETKLNNYEPQNRLVIVGNDSEAQETAIRKGAGTLVAVWTEHIEESMIALAKEYCCPIILPGRGIMNTPRYLFFSPPIKLPTKIDLVSFNKSGFVDEVRKKMLELGYHGYPMIDDENHLIDYVSRYHTLNQHNKKAILVNHNEYVQSMKSTEKADLLEVMGHHRVYDTSTNRPISFHNEVIGGVAPTTTFIYLESQTSIPKDIADLLLDAILSNTLKFKSPTTTAKNKGLARMPAEIAELDIDVSAEEMFKVNSNINNKIPHELPDQGIKKFEIDGRTVMIPQVIVYQVSEVREIKDTLQSGVAKFAQGKELDLLVIVFTSILENGSVFYAVGDIADVVTEASPNHFEEEHNFQEDTLSRKNQIVLLLSRIIINSVHRLSGKIIPEKIVFFTVCQV